MRADLVEGNARMELACEREQWIRALRKGVNRLPDLERQLVALYFGGGLSQVEIASEMSLPHRTVACKLDEALGRLRRRLPRFGLSASAPVVCAETLQEAICSGHEVPPGLYEKVMRRITQTEAQGGLAVSHSGALKKAGRDFDWVPWLGLVGLIGLVLSWFERGVKDP